MYIECQASIKAIIEVDDEEILEKNISNIIKKSSYVKPEEIFEYIHKKVSESMNNVFEDAMKDCLTRILILIKYLTNNVVYFEKSRTYKVSYGNCTDYSGYIGSDIFG